MDDKKGSIDAISKRTHVSKSTVSKALNNFAAVDIQTKEAILQTAREFHYSPAQKTRISKKNIGRTIGVVMPINPYYFWNEAIRGMKVATQQHEDLQVVFSLFANLNSEHDALYCLDYVQDLQVNLLVVAPPIFSSVRKRLEEISAHIPVVCFNETAEFPFTFYTGADFYHDGMRLARASAQTLRSHPNILDICWGSSPMLKQRDAGFREEIGLLFPEINWVGTIDIALLSSPSLSSQLARILHEKYKGAFQSVYVSGGFVPQVCLALQKLKLMDKIPVFGYENPEQNSFYARKGGITAFLEQDIYTQGFCCIDAVYNYLNEGRLPENRSIYVPSFLYECKGGEEKRLCHI